MRGRGCGGGGRSVKRGDGVSKVAVEMGPREVGMWECVIVVKGVMWECGKWMIGADWEKLGQEGTVIGRSGRQLWEGAAGKEL